MSDFKVDSSFVFSNVSELESETLSSLFRFEICNQFVDTPLFVRFFIQHSLHAQYHGSSMKMHFGLYNFEIMFDLLPNFHLSRLIE
jgi:hypothetical protein